MIPLAIALLARELRGRPRRTRAGLRLRAWQVVAAELRRLGQGHHDPAALAAAVAALPADLHELAPLPTAAAIELEQSWKAGWSQDFPDEPWPGMAEARRRLRKLKGTFV